MPKENRVIYLSSFEYPSTHAHPLHALSMARAFYANLGNRFLFVIGRGVRAKLLGDVPHASPYGAVFSVLKFLHIRALGYVFWLFWFLMKNPAWRENLAVFSNDLKLVAAAGLVKPFFKFRLIAEVHGFTGGAVDGMASAAADTIVCVTQGLAGRFMEKYPDSKSKITVMPNAVDSEGFANANAGDVRVRLGIPAQAFVIGYVGRFKPMESDKGVDFLIDSLPSLPNEVHLLLVGGTEAEIAAGRTRAEKDGAAPRVHFVPLVPFDERFPYFLAANALAYVPPKEDRFLREETSPMKLYEYMAAGRPIIASDMPAFREALGADAFFIRPGSTEDFVQATARARSAEGNDTAARAYQRVLANSWAARAKRILETI